MRLSTATDYLIWGIIAHLVADWLLQNDWMANYKTSLAHPAAWVHGGIQLLAMWLVFPLKIAAVLGVAHLLVDTRKPLHWWRTVYRQTTDGPVFISFAMWQDQAVHICSIAIAAFWMIVFTLNFFVGQSSQPLIR